MRVAATMALMACTLMCVHEANADTRRTSEWLLEGEAITAPVPVEIAGQLLFGDTSAPLGPLAVLCDAVMVGTIGQGGDGVIVSFRGATGRSKGAHGSGLICESEAGCARTIIDAPVRVHVLGSPWRTTLRLSAGDVSSLTSVQGSLGYQIGCRVLGIPVMDDCSGGLVPLTLVNDPTSTQAAIPVESELARNAYCSLSGKASGIDMTDEELVVTSSRGLITISSRVAAKGVKAD